mmetsp:Transcript_114103/g.285448  ORF Transcript_114103/g.285448 Transcript_114103/m.285448 type:complete len:597 (-) Transcript_114103:57-1847(-)
MSAFFPISELSTYHSKWVIRARVTAKGQLRSFSSKGGTNQVFDTHLLDESGSEIRASFFGQMAEVNFPKLQQGKVYTFSRGNVKIANRQYNRCNHRYELVFDRDALIEEAADDAKIDSIKFSFVDLHAVQSKAAPCTVDLCGVVVGFKPVLAFTSREGKELVKREITLADDTATSLSIALWGERAKQEDKVFEGNPVICLKGVAVREWNSGRSGSLMEAGVMQVQPKLPEVQRLQQWWAKSGSSVSLTSLSMSFDAPLTDLRTLQSKALPCTVELCGVIASFRPTFSFTSKDGKELTKREITVADDSGMSMTVTLWGDRAKQEDQVFDKHPVVSIKGVVVKEWNGGRSGSLIEAGSLSFQPTTPEAQRVQQWWSDSGSKQRLTALSQEGGGGGARGAATSDASTIAEMRQAAELVSSQPEVFNITCRLATVQTAKQGQVQPLYYMACQEPRPGSSLPCQKRVGEDGFCAACNRAGKAAPRMNIRCRFSDFADSAWLTTFHEAAQKVLGYTAEQVKEMESGEGGRDGLEAAVRRCYFSEPLQLTIRAKLDSYNGEQRANITCSDARPVQRGVHGRSMLSSIKEMLARQAESAQTGGA